MRIGSASFQGDAGRVGVVRLCVGLAVPLVVVAAITAWLVLPEPSDAGDDDDWSISPAVVLTAQNPSSGAESAPADAKDAPALAVATAPGEPATVRLAAASPVTPEAKPAEASPGKSPVDGLRIVSQFWRRGGLGSKALVTLTLRNGNDFAVGDVEVACAFIRRDGSHLTDRRRQIPGTIAMKSRKTYSRMLIGFVNINASKAKCSVVTASRL
jgi:hypothetical protein